MSPHVDTHGLRPYEQLWFGITQCVVWAAAALFFAISFAMLVRRCTGDFRLPLSPAVLIATAVTVVIAVNRMRAWWDVTLRSSPQPEFVFVKYVIPAASLVMLGGALSIPNTKAWGVAVFWLILLTGECSAFVGGTNLGKRFRKAVFRPRQLDDQSPTTSIAQRTGLPRDLKADASSAKAADTVTQQFTRLRDAQGRETIEGTLRAEFRAGQRHTDVHVAFCPPLRSFPRVAVTPGKSPAVALKVAEAMPYGMRIEVRRRVDLNCPAVAVIVFRVTPSPDTGDNGSDGSF